MMKLERDGQGRFEQPLMVFAPSQEGIGEEFGIDTHHTVNLAFCQGRGVDGHIVVAKKVVFVRFVNLARQAQIVFIELAKVR